MDPRSAWQADLDVLAAVTAALDRTLNGLDDPAAGAPCALPGWSRGHVLTHLARNADGMRELLAWARDGRPRPMYPSVAARNADIEEGSARPAAVLRADVAGSAARLSVDLQEVAAVDDAALAATLGRAVVFGAPRPGATTVPAASLPAARAREVAIHHVDLALGYGPIDWPAALARRVLADVAGARSAPGGLAGVVRLEADDGATGMLDPDAPGEVLCGPAWALAWWCTGRPGHAETLRTGSGGPPPVAVPW